MTEKKAVTINTPKQEDPDNDFQQLIAKYSHFLNSPSDPQKLLELGQKLFDENSNEEVVRPSYLLLKKKEQELTVKQVKPEAKVKALPTKERHTKPEQSQTKNEDIQKEELLFLQDRNALFLARRKNLENQRNKMLEDYGQLMEQSVQRKVQLKLDMQKLKAELNEALSRSRPEAPTVAKKELPPLQEKKPIMEELADLNQQVLMRIGSFKMAMSNNKEESERAVLDRYKPHMEKILGQIYAYSEYLPVNDVIQKFNQISDEIDHETRKINTQLKNEHERNYQLQKEASQLGEEVKEHEIEVSRLKQRNLQLQKEISLLKEIAEKEINDMKSKYQSLLNDEEEQVDGPPSSARAMIVSIGTKKKLKRSVSRKKILTREMMTTTVPPVEKFVEMIKAQLLDKINHAQNN